MPEATMAQRISRAKRTISGVRFDRPGDVATVLRVLYLVFNEGYSGDVDLAAEAIRLTRQLAARIDHPEVAGLLALMLLHHARRAARTASDGSLVPLAEQNRARWDTALIAEGVGILQAALARDRLGEFQAQAAIAALHADAPTAGETDWVQIVEWYDELTRLTDSPIVRLNRAVAVGEADGPRAGLAALAALDASLPRHAAVAAYLHERDGDLATAARLYAEAAHTAPNLAERDHLTRQAARLNAPEAADGPRSDSPRHRTGRAPVARAAAAHRVGGSRPVAGPPPIGATPLQGGRRPGPRRQEQPRVPPERGRPGRRVPHDVPGHGRRHHVHGARGHGPGGAPATGRDLRHPHPAGRRSVLTAPSSRLLGLGQRGGDQRVGVAVAEAVLGLQPGDQLHVLGQRGGADEVLPLRDRATVLLLDGREVAGGALHRCGAHVRCPVSRCRSGPGCRLVLLVLGGQTGGDRRQPEQFEAAPAVKAGCRGGAPRRRRPEW